MRKKTNPLSPFLNLARLRADDPHEFRVSSGRKPYGVAVFLIALFVYVLTVSPAVYTYDSAELALGVYYQGIIHSSGYPAYLLLGKLFLYLPLHPDYAVRLNLFSALMGAATVYLLYKIIAELIGYRPLANVVAVLLFAFSLEVWSHSVVAEVYALHTALIALAVYVWLVHDANPNVRYLTIIAAVFGIAFAHHLASTLVALVVYPYLLWQAPKWRVRLTMIAITGGITLLLYLYLPLRFATNPPINILVPYFERSLLRPDDLIWHIRGGMFADRMLAYPLPEYLLELMRFGGYWLRNFHLGVFIGIFGIGDLWRRYRSFCIVLLSIFCIQVLFFSSYAVFDKKTMFHTAYMVWAIFIAAGIASLLEYRFVRVVSPALIVLIIVQLAVNWSPAGHFRDVAVADRIEHTLHHTSDDALLIGPWTAIWPTMYYQKIKRLQPDVTLINYTVLGLAVRDSMPDAEQEDWDDVVRAHIDRAIQCHPHDVYVVEPEAVEGRHKLTRISDDLYRVERTDETNTSIECNAITAAD